MTRTLADDFHLPEREPAEQVEAVIAIGSNLGDSDATIEHAVDALRALPHTDDVRVSPVLRTVALGLEGLDPDRPRFSNAVAIIRTSVAAHLLLRMLQRIETEHGRERLVRWGDRTLDLDIITYGDVRSDDPQLTIPHPRAFERTFVLEPWHALDPDAQLPGHGAVADLLAALRASEPSASAADSAPAADAEGA